MANVDTTKYSKRELGDAARERIVEPLSWHSTLSKSVLESFNVSNSKAFSFLPVSLDDEGALEFETGGLMQPECTLGLLIDYIENFLSLGAGKILLSENWSFSKSAPCVKRFESNVLSYDEEVYHALVSRDNSRAQIKRQLLESGGWQSYSFLTSLPDDLDIETEREVSLGILTCLAARTEVIIMDCYDSDGHIYMELSGL